MDGYRSISRPATSQRPCPGECNASSLGPFTSRARPSRSDRSIARRARREQIADRHASGIQGASADCEPTMAGAANRGDGSYYADECHNETLIRAVSEVRPPPLNTPNRPDAKQTQPKPDGHQFAPTHDGIRQREESADRKSVTDRSTRNSCKRRSHLHTDVATNTR